MPIHVRGLAPLFEVFDMPTSIAFYRDVLGFDVVATSSKEPEAVEFGWALLRLDNCELMLNTAYETNDLRPPFEEPRRIAGHADTCIFFGCPDVDGAYAFLLERGVPVQPPEVQTYGMKQLYVTDPDGYKLCFQWPLE